MGGLQHVGDESLGRLDGPQLVAADRLPAVNAADRVNDRDRGGDSHRTCPHGSDHPSDDLRRHQGPGGVVDEDDGAPAELGIGADCREAAPDRILPLGAASDDPPGSDRDSLTRIIGERTAEPILQVGRRDDDEMIDAAGQQTLRRVGDERPAREEPQRLRCAATEPNAGTGRRQDGDDRSDVTNS